MKTNEKQLTLETLAAGSVRPERIGADVHVFPGQTDKRYVTGLAASDRALEAAFRLRYEIFNLELNEGLSESAVTGLDRDELDDQMDHLLLVDCATSQLVGTYRMQTVTHALARKGLYSAQEYRLEGLEPYYPELVELGRACVAQGHRSMRAIMTLWLGIGAYLNLNAHRYVFGCCSVTTTDPDDGWRTMKTLREKGYLHPTLMLEALDTHKCGSPSREFDPDLGPALKLPKLFSAYMRMGVRVISEPAVDRGFGTIDFLVLLDGKKVAYSPLDVVR